MWRKTDVQPLTLLFKTRIISLKREFARLEQGEKPLGDLRFLELDDDSNSEAETDEDE